MSLRIVPIGFKAASRYVDEHHRHNKPPRGMKFCLAAADGDELVGVAIIGRPVARHLDDGLTLEVTRTCTEGGRNVNSLLYGAAWRAAKALGYTRLVTYTQAGESGASLRAAGWRVIAERTSRKGWDTPTRARDNSDYLSTDRMLWEAS